MGEVDKETKELLDKMGFVPSKNEPKDYINKTDDIEAHVDFRKVDGRRWARIGTKFIAEKELNEKVPILKKFKEERDMIENKLLSELGAKTSQSPKKGDTSEQDVPKISDKGTTTNSAPNVEREKPVLENETPLPHSHGVKIPPSPTPNKEQQAQPPKPASQSPNFDFIKEFVGDDLLEIFGDTGTGKSKFVHALALEAIASSKKVFFLDTERNLSKQDIESLGKNYRYTPLFNEIKNIVLKELPKVDLVIIDSVGLPILTRFATFNMKERGNALLDLIAVVGRLKEWAYENNALVVVTNQPESEFGKQEGEIRKPFGDKACFAAKEIWRSQKLKTGLGVGTKCSLESFRSRSMRSGISIMTIEIEDNGTKIIRN